MNAVLDQWDAIAAAPEHHEVLLEDHRIRVIETLIRPGEETAVHTHIWGGYLYVISWSDFIRYDEHRNIMLDSKNVAQPLQPRTAVWAPPLPLHSFRNVGDKDIHVILTEFKDGFAPKDGTMNVLPVNEG